MSKSKVLLILILIILFPLLSFPQTETQENLIPVDAFFGYDKGILLNAQEKIKKETENYIQYYVIYESINDKKVTANLTIPKKGTPPYPVIIYQHGMSESKDNEQVWFGSEILVNNGFAVFSIDADYHGERNISGDKDFVVKMIAGGHFYRMRNMFIQTAVDIRRGIDYLSKNKNIDQEKIGYVGISMGGMIGVMVSAIDERIKAPVFIVTAGNFTEIFPFIRMVPDADEILKIIDPIHYIQRISPRPILMINGLKDTMMLKGAKELFNIANEPKKIIWVDASHIGVPLKEETIKHCIEFLEKTIKNKK